ncbi:hypothetical protein E8E13_007111 [Curvularia kusanoi]|uniref:LPXTG-domain-containing protein n=1 Tax=Curvularia kusanoi TaxID=90978 RepID=A0A9P4WCV7_CURKU|nr:hypothetical protein E8E13_007111 [Curvularia kusanoi]
MYGYDQLAAALKFETCQECQLRSGYRVTTTEEGTSYTEQDSTWFLFNNKGVVDWCIFGRFGEEQNKNISSSSIYQRCSDPCSKIRSSIDYNIKSDPGSFDFCAHNTNANFTADAESCATCLYQYEDLTVLGNVLTTVRDMCDKKPGQNYSLPASVSVYAAARISLAANTTSPPPSQTSSSTSTDNASLSKGAIAGIVLGALLAIIAVLGLLLLLLKKRKNKAKMAEASKDHELAATAPQPPGSQYGAANSAGKDRYSHAAEAPAQQAPVELGDGRGTSEMPSVGTPTVR